MPAADQIRPLLIGVPIALFLTFSAAGPARGWDANALRAEDSKAAAANGGRLRFVGGVPAAPGANGWTDGRAVQQAYAPEGLATEGIQQTAHSGPSRGGTLFGGSNAALPNSTFGGGLPTEKKGPTWNGYKLRMPTKLFSRSGKSGPAAAPNHKLPHEAAALAAARARRPSSAQPAPPRPVATSRDARMPAGTQPLASLPQQNRIQVNNGSASTYQPAAQYPGPAGSMPQTTLAKRQAAPTQAQLPTHAKSQPTAPATFTKPSSAAPIQPQATTNAALATEAKTPADRLILEAHQLAADADREDDFTQIIETCRRARISQPSAPLGDYAKQLTGWALNRRGQLKADSGRTKEAMLDFDDAIRANPEVWRALHNRGVLQAQAGKFEQAFDDFNRTIQINPEFAKAYSNRAALFVLAGDLPSAMEDYGRAIELDPNLAVAHRGRGRVCHLLGRLDDGLDHYDAAVQLTPDDAYAAACRADLLTDLGRYVDAAAGYNRAIQLDPQSTGAYRGSAWLLATSPDESVRDADLAIERARKAIELDDKSDAVNFDTLAAAQASAGDFSLAMQTLRQAIEMAPDDDRDVYQDRLLMYQRAKPYRIAPLRDVTPVNYEQ